MESTQHGIAIESSKWVMPKMTKPFGFLKGLTKVLYGVATGALPVPTGSIFHAATGIIEILDSFGFNKEAGQAGWQLLSRSLLDAFYRLLSESMYELDMTFVDKDMRQLDGLEKKLVTIQVMVRARGHLNRSAKRTLFYYSSVFCNKINKNDHTLAP